MRKLLAWFIFLLFTYLLICASSDSSMKWLSKYRSRQIELLQSDKYIYGDLYGFSYLPKFKNIKDPRYVDVPFDEESTSKLNDLYILCDSYLYSSFDENPNYFSGIRNAYFTRWTEDTLLSSNRLKYTKAILLIECVERNAFLRLKLSEVITRIGFADSSKQKKVVQQNKITLPSLHDINDGVKKVFYNPTLENNLDFILFSRGIYRKLKEFKATINLNFFNRIDNAAYLAQDSSFLYLKETIDPTLTSSSFYPFNDQELNDFVANLNEINDYYLKAGFKKVLISIPANPVAILQTEKMPTNQLLNRLKKHPKLKVEIVDPSDSLKVNASQNYFKSDSHWNQNGAKIWLAFLNRSLDKI